MVLKNPLKGYSRALWKDGLLRKDEYNSVCTSLATFRHQLLNNIITKAVYSAKLARLEDDLNKKRNQTKKQPKRGGLKARNINVVRKHGQGKKQHK